MRTGKVIATFIVVCNLVVVGSAQRRRPLRVEQDVRIRKHLPTVYITFEGFGKAGNSSEANKLKNKQPSTSREAGYIWLRLLNNTRWVIQIPTVDLFLTLGGVRVVHPRYQVEEENGTRARVNEVDRQEFTTLRPGSSAVFPVPKEHLSDGRKIYINFSYQWENENVLNPLFEPVHIVEFGSNKLPQDARQLLRADKQIVRCESRCIGTFRIMAGAAILE